MIEIRDVTKQFDTQAAVSAVSTEIQEGQIFGLVGSNGAGKSTLLRMIAGILEPDSGAILIDGMHIYDNPEAKAAVCFLSDTAWFLPNAKPQDMADFYALHYTAFDKERFMNYMEQFHLPTDRKIATYSKGQKKQVSLFLGICSGTKYLLCDETFDGLDPVVRQAVKGILAAELLERQLTPVISSHNLRELEDICDCVGLIHDGKILFTRDLDTMKCDISKIHCVLPAPEDEADILAKLEVLQYTKNGSLLTMTVRGDRDEILHTVQDKNPVFAEVLPLSLEEIFISETEASGYDITKYIQ